MPLIIISGFPSSGKTTRAIELKNFFVNRAKKVHLISENDLVIKSGLCKNECYANDQYEKQIRSKLKSEVIRLFNKEDVMILDACNYIKGFRYELYCATKSSRGTQCTLFCGIQKDVAWKFNCNRESLTTIKSLDAPYSKDTFEALCSRYEEPNANNRWDSPLFVVFPDDVLDHDSIYNALFESKPLPPNQSTQNPPLSSGSYLFELDQITQAISNDILTAHRIGTVGKMKIHNYDLFVEVPKDLTALQLNRLRKQFLSYTKMHTTLELRKIYEMFVQFLNANFKKSD